MTNPSVEAFLGTIAIVERADAAHSAALEGINSIADYDQYKRTRDAADCALELAVVQIGAVIRSNGDNTSFRLAGIRSTSTSGLGGAVRNWLNAAEKKLAVEPVKARLSIKALNIEVSGDAATVAEAVSAIGSALSSFPDDPFNPHGSGPVPIEVREG